MINSVAEMEKEEKNLKPRLFFFQKQIMVAQI